MAYPTTPYAPGNLQDGVDYPQAAHVNDLRTEVTAIETGLLTGLQHSVSLAQSLSVTGGSTFASSVTFSTGATFGGPLTLPMLSTAGKATILAGNSLALAADATQTISMGSGMFVVHESAQSGHIALVLVASNVTDIVAQTGAAYSTTQGTGNRINITTAAGVTTFQNKYAGGAVIRVNTLKLT